MLSMAQIQAPAREPQATDLQIIAYALDAGYISAGEIRRVALQILGLPADNYEPKDTLDK